MKEFFTLFKYEFKMQTPFFRKGGKKDWLGFMLGLLTIAFLVFVCVEFLAKILRNYVSVEISKVYAPIDRMTEMLNLLYMFGFIVITIIFLEHARKVFAEDKDKVALLRLPVSQRNIFLSKFCVLILHVYITCAIFVLTVNVVTSTVLPLGVHFWFATVGVLVFMPLSCLFFITLFIVPYIKLIELLAHKYTLLFFLFTAILVCAFIAYSQLLNVIQTLLTTGSIRFLFNEKFIKGLQTMHKYSYPASAYATVLLTRGTWLYWLVIVISSIISLVLMYVISKNLYRLTLYRQPARESTVRKPKAVKQSSTFVALLRKEFICVYRQPRHLFSYLSVAMSMPIMVYCCFTLFETLIYNALGIHINFALALSVLLIFGVLTNTFCATNVSRDGLGILKMKTLPVMTDKLFFAKVAFCTIISSLAVIVSCFLLIFATSLQAREGLLCLFIGLAFTLAQVLVATRLDLNYAKVSLSDLEIEKQSTRTLSKVILIGAILALSSSVSVIFFAIVSSGFNLIANGKMLRVYMYAVPALIGLIYLACAIFYYRRKLFRSFEKLAN